MVKVVWSKAATKQLIRIDTRYQKAIKNKVSLLTGFPLVDLDIKKLAETEARYRLRVGDYRILFELSGKEPKILEVQEVKRRQTNTY
ncbi:MULTISPECIES: type II toxin-antitoxin system RelE family toxin [Xenorhabdus]|uniref:Plasmid stabilization system protein n=1 Tax=Xenorhabdus hominickii TaxID=351679 RepID=A0A1V0M459_XENHO|nr:MULTISPECIES: type II toxin-antitoxin system RelE/ParE family toxin [Xenorhabdus]ARD69656.1 Plasmid stabilization system protein [Xenorhabdus hominickii]MDE9454559.1 type II toxin-antitoxin system RelE/ParE family toxin [Xenorhabdus bovienii]MDE9494551.1 type II toxin-antitoxin system RelE/ParE family toxin [Xenorhabdus bovienii]MDE9502948.1 type II toxin-antitoxin system RelE/ParE family toxin [Xenorhabdus bovienii]MDE9526598.1 type II toxin-antitoxin system RelE/ParE family toxin [Xenorha